MEDKRFEFLSCSINDIQNIIRAIDTKVGLLLVFLALPLTSFATLYEVGSALVCLHKSFWWHSLVILYILLFIATWFFSFFTAFRTLTSIHNPNAHLKGAPKNHGSFFIGGLFKFTLRDIFYARKKLKSKLSFEEIEEKFPKDIDTIISELIFEQMKLAYIRDTKIFRQNWAYYLALFWILLGFIGQLLYLFTKNP